MGVKGMVAAGRVGMVYKGIYSEAKSYSRLDVVSYKNSMYVAKKDSVGILPTDTEHWILSMTGEVGNAESIAYDGNKSGLVADNVQDAIDELSQKGGNAGTVNYNELENQPSVNGVTLEGNKTLSELGIQPEGDYSPVNSPEFIGTPTAPTPPENTNNTQIATTAFVKTLISNLINGAPEALDTLKEIADALGENDDAVQALNAAIGNKVDKVQGKGLSTNDFTTYEKDKLAGISAGAEINVQSDWNVSDVTSDAFIKNKPTIPTKTSQLTNDSGYKTTDNDTWKQNTKTSEGYVPAGNGHANQVWGTDANGNPMWRTETGKTPINNLLATIPGNPLDATQGKKLKDEITALNDNLQGFTPVIDESTGKITGYKTTLGGADTVFPFSDSSNPTEEFFDSIYISSSTSVHIPTYGAKYFQITSNPADNYINIRGANSNLGKHLIPSYQNGITENVLSNNSNGAKLDVSNYDFLILGYGVPSSNTTIRNVTVKWFYE